MSANIPDLASAWYPYALEWPIFAAGAALQLAALAALLFQRLTCSTANRAFSQGDNTRNARTIRSLMKRHFCTATGLVSCLLLATFGMLNHDAVLIAAQCVFAAVFIFRPKQPTGTIRSDEPHI